MAKNLQLYTAVLPLALAMALAIPTIGYIAVISAMFLLKRHVVWFELKPKLLTAGVSTYVAVFVLDYVAVGPPLYVPIWWEAIILAPIVEEFVFRALAFSLMPHPLSWIFATLIFGVLHQSNPVLATLYGVALSLTYRGGGYFSSVVIHSVNNAFWLIISVF